MTICSSNSIPGYIPGINQNTNSKRNRDLNVHGFTIYNSQDMEATQVPINRWLAYEDVGYVYAMEYYSLVKRNEILPFSVMWTDQDIITLCEISQRKTNTVCYHLYMKSKI